MNGANDVTLYAGRAWREVFEQFAGLPVFVSVEIDSEGVLTLLLKSHEYRDLGFSFRFGISVDFERNRLLYSPQSSMWVDVEYLASELTVGLLSALLNGGAGDDE